MIEKVSRTIQKQKSNQKVQNQEKKWKSRNQEKKTKTPKNKIQILIDDSVVQKLISAMGFGAVIWGDLDTYFSGRYLVFQGDIWLWVNDVTSEMM